MNKETIYDWIKGLAAMSFFVIIPFVMKLPINSKIQSITIGVSFLLFRIIKNRILRLIILTISLLIIFGISLFH